MRSGLVVFALWKGYLIFTYFMHMKWEGLICKGMVGFTVPLVAILMLANMPDTSFNTQVLDLLLARTGVKGVKGRNGEPNKTDAGDGK